jgi:hypothetical protein
LCCRLEGHFVVEHEAVMRMRDKKRRKERKRISTRHVTMGALMRLSMALRGSLQWGMDVSHVR